MKLREKLGKYQVIKNTSVMALAQIVSRIGMIFYLGALARHVGSEGVGAISTGTALNSMLLLFVGPGLTILLVREVAAKRDSVGQYVSNAFFLRSLLIIPFVLAATFLAYQNNYPPETITIVHLYTVVFVMDTLGEVMIGAMRAYERMELEALLQIIRDFTNIGLSLVAISLGWPLIAIVAISVVAQAIKFSLSIALLWKYIAKFSPRVDLSFSKGLLLASLPFGVLLIIQTIQGEFGTYVLSVHHSADIVGVYAAANTLILMLLYLPNAFASAIFPNFSRLFKESPEKLRQFYRVCYKYLLILGFPLAVGTLLVGEQAILLVYGDDFTESAPVIRLMAIFLFTIVGYANGSLLYAIDKQKFYAWTQVISAALNAVLCLLLIPGQGPIGAAIAFSASGILTFFIHSIACHRFLGLPLPLGDMARVFVAAAAMGLGVILTLRLSISWVIASVAIAPALYLLALYTLRLIDRDELRTLGGARSADEPETAPVLGAETADNAIAAPVSELEI